MFEEFAAILGVAGAIESSLNIIDRLKKDRGELSSSEVEEMKQLINDIRNTLIDFAISFDELEAWKQVHDITNNIKTDLVDTFRIVGGSLDSHAFASKFSDNREKILLDLKSMRDNHQSLPKLKIYKSKQNLRKIVEDNLKSLSEDDKPWCDIIIELINSSKDEAENYNGKEVYVYLDRLYTFNSELNSFADDAIIAGITKYHQVTQDLRTSLDSIEI